MGRALSTASGCPFCCASGSTGASALGLPSNRKQVIRKRIEPNEDCIKFLINYLKFCVLTDAIETRVEDHDGATIADDLGNWIHKDGQIASNVVHHKQEDSDG